MGVAVDEGAGGEFAEAEAFDFEEGDEAVVGGFEVFDAEGLFDFFEDFFVAADFSGDVAADVDDVFATGLEAEFFVEGGGVLDFGGGDFEEGGGFVDGLRGDEAVFVHDEVEEGEEGGLLARIAREIFFDDLLADRFGDVGVGAGGAVGLETVLNNPGHGDLG